jgi:hypothetical protein
MTVDLTAEEFELLLKALKDHVTHRRAAGLPSQQAEDLIARLEQQERDLRRSAGPAP